MEKKKPNWIKIKNEYITTDISQRKLATKYNVPYNTLRGRVEREKWVKVRGVIGAEISAKTAQKIAEKTAEKESDYILNLAEINTLAAKRAKEILASGSLRPADLKSVTSALKDVSNIAAFIGQGGEKNRLVDEWAKGVVECDSI